MRQSTPSPFHVICFSVLRVAAIAALSCGGQADEEPKEKQEERFVTIAPQDVATIERKEIAVGPRVSGTLEAKERATVRAEAQGTLVMVASELGEKVTKGMLLAKIENSAQRVSASAGGAAVRAADEQLSLTKREFERMTALLEGGAVSRRDVDKSKSALASAELQAQQARAQSGSARTLLANTTVRSPMDGVISSAPVRKGDVVSPGSEIFTIIKPESMRLAAALPSDDLASVKVGATVRFAIRGYPGKSYEGKVTRVAPAVDPLTRQLDILVDIPNESGELIAGLYAEGRLSSSTRSALVAPLAAIDINNDGAALTKVVDNTVERSSLLLGDQDSGAEVAEILEGAAEGDTILLRSFRNLTPGTRIKFATSAKDAAKSQKVRPSDDSPVRKAKSEAAKALDAGVPPKS